MLEKKDQFRVKISPEERDVKKKPPLEEKTEIIRDYIRTNIISKEKGEDKEFFCNLTSNKLKEFLGRKGLNLVYNLIAERGTLLEKMRDNNLTIEEVQEFGEKRGYNMLPLRMQRILINLDCSSGNVKGLLSSMQEIPQNKEFQKVVENSITNSLKDIKKNTIKLRRENDRWQKSSELEKGAKKKIKIIGFKEFDTHLVKGEELVKKAIEILPDQLLSDTISKIRYSNRKKQLHKETGIEGDMTTSFQVNRKREKGHIIFHRAFDPKSPLSTRIYLGGLPRNLAYEWGRSLDPRIMDQRNLNPAEQFQMIRDWEEVRMKTEERSVYVEEINNPNKKEENLIKSKESLVESFVSFLDDPGNFGDKQKRRYQFCLSHFKKYFPDFILNSIKRDKSREEYYSLLTEFLISKYEKHE